VLGWERLVVEKAWRGMFVGQARRAVACICVKVREMGGLERYGKVEGVGVFVVVITGGAAAGTEGQELWAEGVVVVVCRCGLESE
jgi:hypothetical protein